MLREEAAIEYRQPLLDRGGGILLLIESVAGEEEDLYRGIAVPQVMTSRSALIGLCIGFGHPLNGRQSNVKILLVAGKKYKHLCKNHCKNQ